MLEKYLSGIVKDGETICWIGAICLRNIDSFTHQGMIYKEKLAVSKTRFLLLVSFQIPYFEFEELRTQEEEVQYLHNKIFPTIFKFSHKS